MKKTFILFSCFFLLAATTFAYPPNEKVLKSFQIIVSNPREVKWFDHANYYEVSFIQTDVRSTVKFDLEGNFISSTRYYKEQQLPTSILYKLKKGYAGKHIFGVTELTTNEDVHYYVKLEDDKNWFIIKVNGNGQMELSEKYRKA